MNHERIRLGGSVKRYHTRHTIGDQTVAAHSWGVIAILFEICDPSVNLLRAATYHDVAEYDTGDIPATAKWLSASLKGVLDEMEAKVEADLGISPKGLLIPREIQLLKYADILELCWYGVEQRKMGNQYAEEWYRNGMKWLAEHYMPGSDVRVSEAIRQIQVAWCDVTKELML